MTETTPDPESPNRSSRTAARVGFGLILLSGVLWFSLFAIPFTQFSVGEKTAIAAGVFVGVQIAWWSGAALVGPAAVSRMKAWLRRSRDDDARI